MMCSPECLYIDTGIVVCVCVRACVHTCVCGYCITMYVLFCINITTVVLLLYVLYSDYCCHYCRDSYYEIRALCINELGVWMNYYR